MGLHIHFFRLVDHPYGERHMASYHQCRCGKRKAIRGSGGWQPYDKGWVSTGSWTPDPEPIVFARMKPSDAASARP